MNNSFELAGPQDPRDGSDAGERQPLAERDVRKQADYAALNGALLASVIEREIIPRLFLAHRGPPPRSAAAEAADSIMTLYDRTAFAEFVLTSETVEIKDQLRRLIDQGISPQRIYLDLLAPVARQIAELWKQDLCDFARVTRGLARLHQILIDVGQDHL